MEQVNTKWCPLYGKLPKLLNQNDEATKTSIDIIHKARTLFNPELHRIAHRLFKKLLNTRNIFIKLKPLSPEGLRLLEVALINKTLKHLIPKKSQKRIDKPIEDYHILEILAIQHAFIALQANRNSIAQTLGINPQEEIDYAKALVKDVEEYCGITLELKQANGQRTKKIPRGIKQPYADKEEFTLFLSRIKERYKGKITLEKLAKIGIEQMKYEKLFLKDGD